MEYEISTTFYDSLDKIKSKIIINCIFLIVLFVVYSSYFYISDPHHLVANSVFITFLAFVFILLQYKDIIPKLRAITSTAIEVTIEGNNMSILTAPFNVLKLIDVPSKEMMFVLDETRLRIISYPIKNIFDLDKVVFAFTDPDKAVKIMVDYFPKELEQKINEIYY